MVNLRWTSKTRSSPVIRTSQSGLQLYKYGARIQVAIVKINTLVTNRCGHTANSYLSDLTSCMEQSGNQPSRLVSPHQSGWRKSFGLLMSEIIT